MDTIINQIQPCLLTPLVMGFILDFFVGDPHWLPHPIRLFGKLIFVGEKHLNSGKNRILKGGILSILLTGIVFLFFMVALRQLKSYPQITLITESILVFFGIANKSLITECLKVEKSLKKKGIGEARKQLSTIVGRDTGKLSKNQIRIASLETLSENLSDGVIAPLFYYAIGGVPFMFAYKMVNTLDSMIGYKNERFYKFGKIAARTDDVLNFVPARITALLMFMVSFSWRGFVFIFRYGNKHSSPNAGYPEAALAGILNCRFGGTNYYQGKMVEKPVIGKKDRNILNYDLKKAFAINLGVASIFVFLIVVLFYL
ncbi:MAG: adenosylcobinamide-phosphate synthase CbiB [Bacteroidota bacterium]|nr:adenosylcobinamide-phosphate synthase CbiB [Bacteroidota bacterium]